MSRACLCKYKPDGAWYSFLVLRCGLQLLVAAFATGFAFWREYLKEMKEGHERKYDSNATEDVQRISLAKNDAAAVVHREQNQYEPPGKDSTSRIWLCVGDDVSHICPRLQPFLESTRSRFSHFCQYFVPTAALFTNLLKLPSLILFFPRSSLVPLIRVFPHVT